jgi:hypothetical protein
MLRNIKRRAAERLQEIRGTARSVERNPEVEVDRRVREARLSFELEQIPQGKPKNGGEDIICANAQHLDNDKNLTFSRVHVERTIRNNNRPVETDYAAQPREVRPIVVET